MKIHKLSILINICIVFFLVYNTCSIPIDKKKISLTTTASSSDAIKNDKTHSMPIDYNEFDLTTAVSSGGVTGSKQVKMHGKNYQLKPSIKDNALTRRAKANWTDRENFGEVISSKIARKILNTESFEAAPNVSLVYDKARKATLIASKYLEGDKVRTLSAFIQEKYAIEIPEGQKHIKFIFANKQKGGAGPGEFGMGGEEHASLRKDIARGIACSIIIGDHDINPGNFVVVSKDGQDRVARIDFGHAFNDLLNTFQVFGGRIKNQDNQVLDYLNREKVAGIKFGGDSKLWKSFPGIVPTQEMADAFKELSQSKVITKGIAEGKAEFSGLLELMKQTGDENGINHVKKSLIEISSNISDVKLDAKQLPESIIAASFDSIEKFIKKNQDQMASVAKLMQLQVDIDAVIEGLRKSNEPTKEQISQIIKSYIDAELIPGIGLKDSGLEWIKTILTQVAHKGVLKTYVTERSKQLRLNTLLLEKLLEKIEVALPKTSGDSQKNKVNFLFIFYFNSILIY